MGHGLMEHDSMFSVDAARRPPWHGLGLVLEEPPLTIDDAIKAAGLDWEVIQRPVYVGFGEGDEIEVEQIEDYYANIRVDTGKPLGIVTGRYTPVQNLSAFSFLANLFGTEMAFETAGSLQNGRRVWVMMRLPEWVEVGGDKIGQYAFVSNSHDGKSSVLAAMTPIRIVCANTLGAAVRLAEGANAQRTYTIRHTGDMSTKIAEARNVLQVTINYYKQFAEVGDKLALAKISDQGAWEYVKNLMPVENDMKERAARNRAEAQAAVMSIFKGESEHPETVGNAPGTFWCLYNAATEFADWYRDSRTPEGRFQRTLDDPDGFKSRAWELALSGAGLS